MKNKIADGNPHHILNLSNFFMPQPKNGSCAAQSRLGVYTFQMRLLVCYLSFQFFMIREESNGFGK